MQEDNIQTTPDGSVRKRGNEDRKPQRRWTIILALLAFVAVICFIVTVVSIISLPSLQDAPTSSSDTAEDGFGLPDLLAGVLDQSPPTPTTIPTPAVPLYGGRSIGDYYIPELGNTGYDVQRYSIQLALDPADDFVVGATTIEAKSNLHGLAEMSLDFIGYEIGSVTVDGISALFRREENKLIIELPERLTIGTQFSIVVSYRGRAVSSPSPYVGFVDQLGLIYPDGESLFAVAEPDGARYWFPANDHPRDKAEFRFEIVVPTGLTAVANGQLLGSMPSALPDGRVGELFIWEHNNPMAPYLALVAVGPYEYIEDVSAGGVPLRYYTFPELREEVIEATSIVGEAIDWMSETFGPYPFESFGFVTARLPGASMETQTMVLLSDVLIGQRTAVHELAHMWFGDWVSLDSWSEMWRNEGFASYVQFMWETRNNPENLPPQLENVRSAVENNQKNYPLDDPPREYLFEFNIYYKGALAIHSLRQQMGDEAFFGGLRSYFEKYGGGTASDEEFREVMEEAAGYSLESIFSEWFP